MKPMLMVLTTVFSVALVGQTAAQAERSSTQASLEVRARWTAQHGGITGSCYGCATGSMKSLASQLVVKQFSRAGSSAVRWALCVVRRESGFNPGAINSSSGASGLFQFLGHPQYSNWMLTHDPVGQVRAAWQLSHGAQDRSPWYGGGYSC